MLTSDELKKKAHTQIYKCMQNNTTKKRGCNQ